MSYSEMNKNSLAAVRDAAKAKLDNYKSLGLKLDLTRGKPGAAQLELTEGMLTALTDGKDCTAENGLDCRNYGCLDGIPEAKRLFSTLLDIPEDNLIVCGNSSLNLMYDTVARAMLYGVVGGVEPWCRQGKIKFVCPAPGYDRHFGICESLGIEMITVDMTESGPDMDAVRAAVEGDPAVKGMWCCPKFSNPDGCTYSDETVEAIAALKPAAPDFRVFWDNAYAVHELYDEVVPLADIFEASKKYGNENIVFYFASTSKISFPGSGVAVMAASDENIAQIKSVLTKQTIGFDKLNQLRHVKFFKNKDGILAQMKRHADVIRPKFECVERIFDEEISDIDGVTWTRPRGGYFISLYLPDGCAKAVYDTANSVGVALTKAGATYPYGVDPRDRNLRIAPTYPSAEDLELAVRILCEAIKFVCADKMLNK